MNIHGHPKYQKGFSGVLELGITAALIALTAGVYLAWVNVDSKHKVLVVDKNLLTRAQATLDAYGFINAKLPCPATSNNGKAANYCNEAAEGFFPYETLGIPDTRFGVLRYNVFQSTKSASAGSSLTLPTSDRLKLLYIDDKDGKGKPVEKGLDSFADNYNVRRGRSDGFLAFCQALASSVDSDTAQQRAYSLKIPNEGFIGRDYIVYKTRHELLLAYNCPALMAGAARMHVNAVAAADMMHKSTTPVIPYSAMALDLAVVNLVENALNLGIRLRYDVAEAFKSLQSAQETASKRTSDAKKAAAGLDAATIGVKAFKIIHTWNKIGRQALATVNSAASFADQTQKFLFATILHFEQRLLLDKVALNAVNGITSGVDYPFRLLTTSTGTVSSASTPAVLEQIDAKSKELNAESSKLDQLKKELEALIKDPDDSAPTLFTSHGDAIKAKVDQIADSQAKIEVLRQDIMKLYAQIVQVEFSIPPITHIEPDKVIYKEIDELSSQLNEKMKEKNSLNCKIPANYSRCETLDSEINALQSQLDKATNELMAQASAAAGTSDFSTESQATMVKSLLNQEIEIKTQIEIQLLTEKDPAKKAALQRSLEVSKNKIDFYQAFAKASTDRESLIRLQYEAQYSGLTAEEIDKRKRELEASIAEHVRIMKQKSTQNAELNDDTLTAFLDRIKCGDTASSLMQPSCFKL